MSLLRSFLSTERFYSPACGLQVRKPRCSQTTTAASSSTWLCWEGIHPQWNLSNYTLIVFAAQGFVWLKGIMSRLFSWTIFLHLKKVVFKLNGVLLFFCIEVKLTARAPVSLVWIKSAIPLFGLTMIYSRKHKTDNRNLFTSKFLFFPLNMFVFAS